MVSRVSLSQLLCGSKEGTPNFPGARGGMHVLAVGLPASLIDNYCIGGDRSLILRSPGWTTHNRDQWGSQPYLETAIVPDS